MEATKSEKERKSVREFARDNGSINTPGRKKNTDIKKLALYFFTNFIAGDYDGFTTISEPISQVTNPDLRLIPISTMTSN